MCRCSANACRSEASPASERIADIHQAALRLTRKYIRDFFDHELVIGAELVFERNVHGMRGFRSDRIVERGSRIDRLATEAGDHRGGVFNPNRMATEQSTDR